MIKPEKLYHGSPNKFTGQLQPVLKQDSPDHVHHQASVFATEREDIAALFMFPTNVLASIGFEQNIAYICIWGTPEEYIDKDREGFIYVLPSNTFEKIGKEYEWQSFEPVTPRKVTYFDSVLIGMLKTSIQVYFINDNDIFNQVVVNKSNRAPLLKTLVSENQKNNINVKSFN